MPTTRTEEYNLKAPRSWKLRHMYTSDVLNMENDLKEEPNRRMGAAWAAFATVREATDQLTDQDLRAHLFDSTIFPALCYAAETPLPRLGS
ncbi:hypothetical protein RB195_012145 [Necator americanus]|uniref:Uncharacterized protein n=1 Tax=Necator americanus TaxID=51031 RepID=A0ABR1D5R2_NECAM